MPQILFIVEVPEVPANSPGMTVSPEWLQFEESAKNTMRHISTAKRLQKNCWLLSAEKSWSCLHSMSKLAEVLGLSYSVLLLPGDAVELSAGPSRKMSVMPFPA